MSKLCPKDCCIPPVPVRVNGVEWLSERQVTLAVATRSLPEHFIKRAYIVAAKYQRNKARFDNPFKHGIRRKGKQKNDLPAPSPFTIWYTPKTARPGTIARSR